MQDLSCRKRLSINSRLCAKPKNFDKDDTDYISDMQWESILFKKVKKKHNFRVWQPLLTNVYKSPDFFGDHYTYDMVLIFNVGGLKKIKVKKIIVEDGGRVLTTFETERERDVFEVEIASVLGALKRAKLKTALYFSQGYDEIYCLIGASEKRLRLEAARTRMDLRLEADKVLHRGLEKNLLISNHILKLVRNRKEDLFLKPNIYSDKKYLDERLLDNLYGHFQTSSIHLYEKCEIDSRRHPNTPFTMMIRLKLMRSIIEAETLLGGANLQLVSLCNKKTSSVIGFFPLHDNVKRKILQQKLLKVCSLRNVPQPAPGLRDYFGEEIGFYFCFLHHYVMLLIPVAVIGSILTVAQRFGYTEGSTIFGLVMCLWSTFFLETWKRKTSALRMRWGMEHFVQKETDRPEFDGDFVRSPVTGEFEEFVPFSIAMKKLFLSHVIVITYISVVGVVVVSLFFLRSFLMANFVEPFMRYNLASIIRALVIIIFNMGWGKLAVKLNDYENHKTDSSYQNSLVLKTFAFKFVNSYSSLFYIVAYKRYDMGVGYCQGSYEFFVNSIPFGYWYNEFKLNNGDAPNIMGSVWSNWTCKEGAPSPSPAHTSETLGKDITILVCDAWKQAKDTSLTDGAPGWDYRGDCLAELGSQLVTLFGVQLIVNNALELLKPIIKHCLEKKKQAIENVTQVSQAEQEAEFPPYEGTFADYDELVIQFGYVCLFVGAFPVVPLLALANNWLENYIDGSKMLKYNRRPLPRGAYNIGSWYKILELISYVSIITISIMCFLNWNKLFSLGNVNRTLPSRLSLFLLVEHILITSKVLMCWLIPDSPKFCDEHTQRNNKVVEVLMHNEI